jgi:predicted RNA-binding Zn-ribbon protein involved in translation (DUF1610 family)
MAVRHRIHELYSEKRLQEIEDIRLDPMFPDNNKRIDAILHLMRDMDVTFIASGTNRMSYLLDGYIHKVAMDSFGVNDNWNEFKVSPLVQPWVTKTYECNGLICVAEYVNLFTKQEFVDSREHIREILKVISEDWWFCDMGLVAKNYTNFGYDDDDNIKILDYAYMERIDRKIMNCRACGHPLKWNNMFTTLVCSKCGREHDPIELRDRMRKDENDFTYDEGPEDGPLEIRVG